MSLWRLYSPQGRPIIGHFYMKTCVLHVRLGVEETLNTVLIIIYVDNIANFRLSVNPYVKIFL